LPDSGDILNDIQFRLRSLIDSVTIYRFNLRSIDFAIRLRFYYYYYY